MRSDPKLLKVRVWDARREVSGKLEAPLDGRRCELTVGCALDWFLEFLDVWEFYEIQIIYGAAQSPAAAAESLLRNAPSTLCRL